MARLKEECGVFGISNNHDASALTALGLHALQHRGQEGCGIVSFDGEKWLSPRALQAKIGVCGLKDVLKVYPDIQYKLIERKHRYLYFLCNKGEKKRLIKQLKHPVVDYV